MADYDDIMQEIAIRCPGSSLGAQQLELKAVLRDFCDRTSAWVLPAGFVTIIGTNSYAITTSAGSPNRLMNVVDAASGTPVAGSFQPPNILNLSYIPSQVTALQANVAVLPLATDPVATSVPSWFWSQYHNNLVDGVVARMFSQTAKPYSNPRMAQYHAQAYQSGVNQAKNEMLRLYRFRGQGWAFPRGWGSRRFKGFTSQ